jgi:hypothetical protein
MGNLAGLWNNDMCTKTHPFVCEVDYPPRPAFCPGTDPKGKFSTVSKCPSEVFPSKDVIENFSENELQLLCNAYCGSNCPLSEGVNGRITIASPSGTDKMCVCYIRQLPFPGVQHQHSYGRKAVGGCSYSTQNYVLSPACSKAMWKFPITRFDESYDIGYGFGEPTAENPFGAGQFPDEVKSDAAMLTSDADWNWERCMGRANGDLKENTSAPCYIQSELKQGGKCTCDKLENQTKFCSTLGGSTCSLTQTFDGPLSSPWSAQNMVPACFPSECSNKDIQTYTDYIVNQWAVNYTNILPDHDSLTGVVVPTTAGTCGVPTSSSSTTKTAEIAGGVVGAVVVLGLGGFLFMKFKGRSSSGLSSSLVANKRGTLF